MHIFAKQVTRIVVAQQGGAGEVGEGTVPGLVDAIDPFATRLHEQLYLRLTLLPLDLCASYPPAHGECRPASYEQAACHEEERRRAAGD